MSDPDPEGFADGRLTLRRAEVATLTLHAPATRNAMTRAMWEALPGICGSISADPGIRVLIVTGAGDTVCAGADISEFAAVYATRDAAAAYNAAVRAGQAALRGVAQPVLALIRGACVGGGCGIALACDLRFAGQSAVFAITPAKLGIAYSPADTAQLIEKVGPARAKDILFSARKIDATEALSIGLIDRLCPDQSLAQSVGDYAQMLTQVSPASLRVTKATVNALCSVPGAAAIDLETVEREIAALFSGPDFAEGRAAFMARRKPVWP